jgi:type VI secretion system protein ImpE
VIEALSALKEGNLDAALSQAKAAVRGDPGDVESRARLFQLFCLSGEWDRAEAQLDALMTSGPAEAPIWKQYKMLLRLENQRRETYRTGEVPAIVGDPQDWMAAFGKAFTLHQTGDVAGGQALREQAMEGVPATAGRVGNAEFDWIMDGDSRLGPMLEAFLPTEADYCWVPFSLLGSLAVEKPTQVNHFVWVPAHFTWKNGTLLHGFVPTRYIGSETTGEPAHALARGTDWVDRGGGVFEGRGQRVLLTADDDFPLLDIREARFAV